MILITDIANAIKAFKTDEELSAIIQEFIGEENSVQKWKEDNFSDLRRWSYPDILVYVDAQVKLYSLDHTSKTEGQTQLNKYLSDCLAVKQKYPKKQL